MIIHCDDVAGDKIIWMTSTELHVHSKLSE